VSVNSLVPTDWFVRMTTIHKSYHVDSCYGINLKITLSPLGSGFVS